MYNVLLKHELGVTQRLVDADDQQRASISTILTHYRARVARIRLVVHTLASEKRAANFAKKHKGTFDMCRYVMCVYTFDIQSHEQVNCDSRTMHGWCRPRSLHASCALRA